MEITKNNFKKFILENKSSFLDEDELKRKKKERKSLETIDKRERIFTSDKSEHIGWIWRSDITDKNSPLVTAYFICGDEIEKFIDKHFDTIQHIERKFLQGFYFSRHKCPANRPENSKSKKFFHPSGEEAFPFTKMGYSPSNGYVIKVNGVIVYSSKDEGRARERYKKESEKPQNSDKDVTMTYERFSEYAQTKIKSKLNVILYDTIASPEFREVLNKKSIPPIILEDKKFIDRHVDTWTNDLVEIRSHSYNTYENSKDFLTSVIKRSLGKGDDLPEMNTLYMARQYNRKYRKWEAERFSNIKYSGKTSDDDYVPREPREVTYNLDVSGYKELNLDVSLRMDFELKGERQGNGFTWSISMVNKFGKKRPDDRVISGGLQPVEYQILDDGILDGRIISAVKTVQLEPNIEFTNDFTIMENEDIVNGLREVLNRFMSLVEKINPKDLLKLGNVMRSDIQRVNEHRINKLIKATIKEVYR